MRRSQPAKGEARAGLFRSVLVRHQSRYQASIVAQRDRYRNPRWQEVLRCILLDEDREARLEER